MDISSIGNVSTYSYVNQIEKKQVDSSFFTDTLQDTIGNSDKKGAYKNYLSDKFGVPIMEVSVGKGQKSMDNFASGTVGMGNVAIAPNILEQMANDPEKAAYYEKKIQQYFDSIPSTKAFMASIGHRITSDGIVIHEDGTVTQYLSGEESPEKKAKVEADHKAKREKEAKQRKENKERSQKIADEQKRIEAENYRKRSIESVLHEHYYNKGIISYGDTPESVFEAYGVAMTTYSMFDD